MTSKFLLFNKIVIATIVVIIIPIQCENDQIKKSKSTISFIASIPAKQSEIMIKNGRKEYEILLEKRNLPVYGECWDHAIQRLEQQCNQMDESRQSWLSIVFTDCFLKNMGSELKNDACKQVIELNDGNDPQNQVKPTILSNHDLLKECTRSMIDSNLFNTYTMFFVHTQSICFYLQSEKWQQNTEKLVNNLVHDAHLVSSELTIAVEQIENLEHLQHSSLEAQITINHELNQARINLEQFQQQTRKQQDLIEKIITQFNMLQDFLITEFSTSSSIFFFIANMLVIYFITTPKRTIDIRPWLYMIMIVCFFFEKKGLDYLCWWLNLIPVNSSSNISDSIIQLQWDINQKIWLLRKSMLVTQAFIFIWRLVTFKDLTEINNQILCTNTVILRNIQQQMSSMKSLQNESSGDCSTTTTDSSLSDYETDESFRPDDEEVEEYLYDEPQNYYSPYKLRPNRPTIFIDYDDDEKIENNGRRLFSPNRYHYQQ